MASLAETHANRGQAFHDQGRLAEAEEQYRAALRLQPDFAEVHYNLALLLRALNRLDDALIHAEAATRLKPEHADAHNNRGVILRDLGRAEEAVFAYERALQLLPNYAEVHNNLGNALRDLGRFNEAVTHYRHTLRLKPDCVPALNNLGTVLYGLGRLDEAAQCYEQALRLDPNHADAHWNRALLWLLLGHFEQGWPEYEWRWQRLDQRRVQRSFSQPRWDGSPLNGRTILIHAEQGLGDTIQFIRYAWLLKQQGGRVVLESPPQLASLLGRCPYLDQVVLWGSRLPSFDVYAPLLSLPLLFGTRLDTIPAHVPYLSADKNLVKRWGREICKNYEPRIENQTSDAFSVPHSPFSVHHSSLVASHRGADCSLPTALTIGITWQGSPTHSNDRQRSVPLAAFAPLAALPGVRLFSLQKGAGSEQIAEAANRFKVVELGSRFETFDDTAAALMNLDLVVTVDTAVAHLAGALGVPVWVVLPLVPDWRWLLEREDSPWYPTMRLFRQPRLSDWAAVFQRIAAVIADAACGMRNRKSETIAPPQAWDYHEQAMGLVRQGLLDEAAACLRKALQLAPDLAEAHSNLGSILRMQGKHVEAAASFHRALQLNPDFADAHYNLGNLYLALGQCAEAAKEYRETLRLKAAHYGALNNLGLALQRMGSETALAEAVAVYEQALRLKPDSADAHNNLGNVLQKQGRFAHALASYQEALRLNPDMAEAYNNLGNTLQSQGMLDEAIAAFETALRLRPDYAEALNNLGNVLQAQGQAAAAANYYRQALRLKPHLVQVHSSLVFCLLLDPANGPDAILDEARRWNQQHAEHLRSFIQPFRNRPDPQRRLRIGYVSPDFRDHVDAFFLVPLLSHHDHEQYEVFCYADVARPDAYTERLRSYADGWRSLVGLSDEQAADLIRQDEIDILIDMELHTVCNRLLVFARKPAPVQVCWLGFPGTTGLSTMDYRLTDPYLDPPGLDDAFYSEKSEWLPDTFWCYDPLTDQPMVGPLPALKNGCVTFGCLNNFSKVNDSVLSLWARVLRAIPDSRLLLLAPRGQVRERIATIFQEAHVARARLTLIDKQARADYLRLYQQIDVCLDPFPYNGHTTSLDALWMGVPTVTLVGRTAVGRGGWSQLSNLGMPELAARTPAEYIAIAARLAGNVQQLSDIRQTLRTRMKQSPLMDGPRFARNMEAALRAMWRRWCEDKSGEQRAESRQRDRS